MSMSQPCTTAREKVGAAFTSLCTFAAALIGMVLPAAAQQPVTVVEYYNASIATYFLTGRASEQSILDSLVDFKRTGMSFQAVAAGGAAAPLAPVCRYRIVVNSASGVTSHFYGMPADCALIASAGLTNFSNEGLDFAVTVPANGACPLSAPLPVYRAFRKQTQVDTPNHRYSISAAAYQEMLVRGWAGEGMVFCVSSSTPESARAALIPSGVFEDRCAVPRVGSSPYTGRSYPDRAGSLSDEKSWLRSWKDENYLWYREIPDLDGALFSTAVGYYDALKTPVYVPSGKRKDQFSWSQSTAEYEQSAVGGASFGYGIRWSFVATSPPRKLVVAMVTPGSPAANAGVLRGDSVVSIDGVDLAFGNDVNTLNRGLNPTASGESHRFVFQPAAGGSRNATLVATSVTIQPVPLNGVIDTSSGKVGYLVLTTFSTNSTEAALVNAIAGLQQAGVNDLILDLRYNSGGLVAISSQLAYMIAGPARTAGKAFSRDKFNDKLPYGIFGNSAADVTTPFYTATQGRSVAAGQALPTLNLGRVFVLTTGNSCSASESLINGLRGVDVEAITLGGTTCGKPYAFYPWDNCGTTYYSIQITAANNKGEGDYVEGFSATCPVADDLTRVLGDTQEGMLSAALGRRAAGVCQAPAASAQTKQSTNAADPAQAIGLRQPANEALAIIERPGREAVNPGSQKSLPVVRPVAPVLLGRY